MLAENLVLQYYQEHSSPAESWNPTARRCTRLLSKVSPGHACYFPYKTHNNKQQGPWSTLRRCTRWPHPATTKIENCRNLLHSTSCGPWNFAGCFQLCTVSSSLDCPGQTKTPQKQKHCSPFLCSFWAFRSGPAHIKSKAFLSTKKSFHHKVLLKELSTVCVEACVCAACTVLVHASLVEGSGDLVWQEIPQKLLMNSDFLQYVPPIWTPIFWKYFPLNLISVPSPIHESLPCHLQSVVFSQASLDLMLAVVAAEVSPTWPFAHGSWKGALT